MTSVDAQKIALEENELEDTQWLTEKRLKKLREFSVFDYADAAEQTDGIVIGADAHITKKKQKIKIVTTNQLHALVVGTTGSGKTTGFVDQNIAFLGKSAGKPSLVIADPKQELYEKHAATLKSEGYKICVLNLREPYISAKWNPMEVLIRRIRKVKDLEYNFYEKDGKYYGAGECFLTYAAAQSRMQELKDEIYEIVTTEVTCLTKRNIIEFVQSVCAVNFRRFVVGGIDSFKRRLVHYYSVSGRTPHRGENNRPRDGRRLFKICQPIDLRTENCVENTVTCIEYPHPHTCNGYGRTHIRHEKDHFQQARAFNLLCK